MLHYKYITNFLGAGEGGNFFLFFFFLKAKLTMPALYPGLDKLSRPIEGYPPVGPPPQLPAVNNKSETVQES